MEYISPHLISPLSLPTHIAPISPLKYLSDTSPTSPLYLPCISPTPPLHLPYISPTPPLHLPYTSPTPPLYLPCIFFQEFQTLEWWQLLLFFGCIMVMFGGLYLLIPTITIAPPQVRIPPQSTTRTGSA